MSKNRPGSGRVLPAIRSSYENEFGDPVLREPYAVNAYVSPRAVSRLYNFEGRLHAQERTTQALVERAHKIKEDIIDNLNITHNTWTEEKKHRELLQEHIRTITDVVRKLNHDITDLEKGIKDKDTAIGGTQDNVKNLEMHHVAGLTDVRGRVARCDSSIARLSSDLKGCFDSIRSLNQAQTEQHAKVLERLGEVDARITQLFSKMDQNHSENEIHIRHVESDTGNQVQGLDARTRQMLEETRNMLNTFKAIEGAEREKLETRLLAHLDQQNIVRDQRQDRFERSTEDHVQDLQRRLLVLEEQFIKDKEKTIIQLQTVEGKFERALDAQRRKYAEDLSSVKHESRDGFSVVHESITNMKQVMDGKRKLLEEQIRKEIAQIRKMVVLI